MEISFWSLIVLIVLLLSLPSLLRIYNVRLLYFSSTARSGALGAIIFLRQERGYGATDLKLEKIIKENNAETFYFTYYYHSPRFRQHKKEVIVNVKNNGEQKIINT